MKFWDTVDRLFAGANMLVNRSAGSAHPRYPDMIYPLDYGYLENTQGGDGDGIDVFVGTSLGGERVVGALATVDAVKRDMELKLLVNCTEDEMDVAFAFLDSNFMGVLRLDR